MTVGSDSIEKGLRFVDLKLAELRSPDATYTSYRTISLAINRATDEQKLLVSLIGDKVNFSGYRDYLWIALCPTSKTLFTLSCFS